LGICSQYYTQNKDWQVLANYYEFSKLPDWKPGQGYSKYFLRRIKEHGRRVFTTIVQEMPEELGCDPWGLGNSDLDDSPWGNI
jgi:hypothetical protein